MSKELDDILKKLRGSSDSSKIKPRSVDLSDPKKSSRLYEFDVPKSAIYDRLSDGTYSAKYENYLGAEGNEERLAAQQTLGEKAAMFLPKLAVKTANNFLDATVGTVYGVINGISEGTFSAVWDNDFSNMLDDANKRLDNKLAYYYSKEEKDMHFLQKMVTSNFWFNDVGDGMAFVAGALLPELAIGALSGGTSLGVGLGKLAVKQAGKTVLKEAAEQTAKKGILGAAQKFSNSVDDIFKYSKGRETIKDFYRGALGSKKAGDIVSTAGFMFRTSNFEAGMEARHNFHNAVDSYIANFKEKNGRDATFEEIQAFTDEARKSSNWLYTANLGILGVSNAAMFGKVLDIKVPTIGKKTTNFFNSAIGLGVKTTEGGMLAMKGATKGQKILGNAFKILEKPAIEGLYEEGFQGVAGKTMQNYLNQKYDPQATEAVSMWSGLTDAFAEQYGTKEGWNEMGIGMIIGFAGGGLTGIFGGKQGLKQAFPGLGTNSRKARYSQIEAEVVKANNGIVALKGMQSASAVKHFQNLAESNVEKGDYISARAEFAKANIEFIKSQEHIKTDKEILKDYQAIVESRPIEGLDENQQAEYKASLIKEFKQNLDDYSFANKAVEAVGLDRNIKQTPGNMENIKEALVMNIVLGKNALSNAKEIASQMDTILSPGVYGEDGSMIQSGGIFDPLNHYYNLAQEEKNKVDEIRAKKKTLKNLEKQALKYQQQLAVEQNQRPQKVKDVTLDKKYNKTAEKAVSITQQISQLTGEIETLSEALNQKFQTSQYDLDGTLSSTPINALKVVEEIDKLDSYINSLRISGKTMEANALENLQKQFKFQADAHNEMMNTHRSMLSTGFFTSKKGSKFIDRLVGKKYQMTPEFRQLLKDNSDKINRSLDMVNIRDYGKAEQAVEDAIANNKYLSERDKERLEAIIRLQLNFQTLGERIDSIQAESPVLTTGEDKSSDPLEGDTITLKTQLDIKNRDLNNVTELGKVIDEILEEVDYIKGQSPKADIERRRQGLNGVEEIIFNDPNFKLEGFEIDGNYWNVVTSIDRAKVLVNINGVIVPFYLTTGQAGKGLVPGWYPFFGIGKDGWLNKTDKSDMETYYERYWGKETADIVKSVSDELNSFYGTDPATFKNDGDPNATSRPLTTLADKVEDYINSKLSYTPAINNADARKTLRSNVEQLGKEINVKYDTELTLLENTIKSQDKVLKTIDTPEYKRMVELMAKRENDTISTAEDNELNELESDMDDWLMISGTVIEGFRLSDLIRQQAVLSKTPIADIEKVEEVTEQDLLDESIQMEDKPEKVYYTLGQSYDAVTAVGKDNKVIISGISVESFSSVSGVDLEENVDYTLDKQNNINLNKEAVDKINAQGNIKILAVSEVAGLITRYSIVPQFFPDIEGKEKGMALKGDFKEDFEEPQDPDTLYSWKEADANGPGEEVVFEIDPKDPWNKTRITKIRNLQKDPTKNADKLAEAKEEFLNTAVVRVRGGKENSFGAVLKGNRDNAQKSEEALKFEEFRRNIVSENFEDIVKLPVGNSSPITLKTDPVTVEKVLIGQPNFVFRKDTDGNAFIEYRNVSEVDAKRIVDIGYVENGKMQTQSGLKNTNTTFIKKAIDSNKKSKTPFIVFEKEGKRIAYPVRVIPNNRPDNSELESIFKSKDISPAIKTTKLNKILAERGIDIKEVGNAFISFGENSNLTREFLDEKLAQLDKIEYFRPLEEWVDKKNSIEDIVKNQVLINIDLENPVHSPKVKLDFKQAFANIQVTAPVNATKSKKSNATAAPKKTSASKQALQDARAQAQAQVNNVKC